jgi:hypothetical protein
LRASPVVERDRARLTAGEGREMRADYGRYRPIEALNV